MKKISFYLLFYISITFSGCSGETSFSDLVLVGKFGCETPLNYKYEIKTNNSQMSILVEKDTLKFSRTLSKTESFQITQIIESIDWKEKKQSMGSANSTADFYGTLSITFLGGKEKYQKNINIKIGIIEDKDISHLLDILMSFCNPDYGIK